jgi:DNA-binding IclR family transcriptional regulator
MEEGATGVGHRHWQNSPPSSGIAGRRLEQPGARVGTGQRRVKSPACRASHLAKRALTTHYGGSSLGRVVSAHTADPFQHTRQAAVLETEPDDRYRVQVVDRVLEILEAFSIDAPELGVSELSRTTGLNKGTAHRLLSALERHRLVEQDGTTGRYHLGLRLWELGNRAVARLELPGPAMPALHQLSADTGETAHLAVLDDGDVLYIAKVESKRPLRIPSQVGRRLPPHCTGIGKVLLAWLPPAELDQLIRRRGLPRFTPYTICDPKDLQSELMLIRHRGYALDREELEQGLRCVAAPIRDRSAQVIAAISVAGPSVRVNEGETPRLAEAVLHAAHSISRILGSPIDGPDPQIEQGVSIA